MKQYKPWQIVLFVAAILVLGASLWWSLRTKGPEAMLSRKFMLVDVTTGELFTFSTKRKPAVIPERNPDTGARTLLPADDLSGTWAVESRFLGLLKDLVEQKELDRASIVVDLETGAFTPTGSPRSAN